MTMTLKMLLASTIYAASLAGAPAAAHPVLPPIPVLPATAAVPAADATPAMPPASEADERADDLYDRARNLIEQGRFDRAIADLDRVIALNSNKTDAACTSGRHIASPSWASERNR